ncbi:hypothetical protein ACE6H2_011301 [Prunus campanulata]
MTEWVGGCELIISFLYTLLQVSKKCIYVLLQVLSWGPIAMALIHVAAKALHTSIACVLISNLGESITELARDALVAYYE